MDEKGWEEQMNDLILNLMLTGMTFLQSDKLSHSDVHAAMVAAEDMWMSDRKFLQDRAKEAGTE